VASQQRGAAAAAAAHAGMTHRHAHLAHNSSANALVAHVQDGLEAVHLYTGALHGCHITPDCCAVPWRAVPCHECCCCLFMCPYEPYPLPPPFHTHIHTHVFSQTQTHTHTFTHSSHMCASPLLAPSPPHCAPMLMCRPDLVQAAPPRAAAACGHQW
jgi:hypothetical protein